MTSKIRHSPDPMPMPCWVDGSNSLNAPAVNPTTAPHDCMMPNCPGPENKRKLEVFEELLAALKAAHSHLQELREAWERGAISERDGKGGTRSNRNVDCEVQARAALAKASPHW